MIRTKLFLGCALAAAMLVGPTAFAQEPVDQRTYFTFSAPFELPGGKTLPAGKYTFRVLDSPSNRHIVQIMNEDATQMLATLLAIPAERQDPPSEPEIRFMESSANLPPAVRTWWYPGRTIGHEFIYPKDQARRLAARASEPVLTVAGDQTSTEDMQTAELARINGAGEQTAMNGESSQRTTAADTTAADRSAATSQPPATEPTPAPAPRVAAPAPRVERPVTADTSAARTTTERTELPRTASALPMVALLGVASLAAAAALRRRRA
jgi:hypothetical protein